MKINTVTFSRFQNVVIIFALIVSLLSFAPQPQLKAVAPSPAYSVGQTGPGGGKIFYYSATGFNCGPTFTDRCNYLEVAPSTWNGASEVTVLLGNRTTDQEVVGVPKDSSAVFSENDIGLGYKNSIVFNSDSRALNNTGIKFVRNYRGGSLDDWYVPSSTELNILVYWSKGLSPDVNARSTSNAAILNGNFDTSYWYYSSSQTSGPSFYGHIQRFDTGAITTNQWSDASMRVRPIRAFAEPSNVATLSGLTLSSGTLSPGFATGTTSYTVSVLNDTSTVTVTPTRTQANATIQVRVNSEAFASVTSGSPSASLSLNTGSNTIDVKVTAQDGSTISTYTITVTRAAPLSNDATLSSLTISAGTLSPTFVSSTTSYTASVLNDTSTVTVTPTRTQANSTIQVRVNAGSYAAVTSGSASGSLSLNVGSNTINVLVTAQDGTTTATYTMTVTRAAANSSPTTPTFSTWGNVNKTYGDANFNIVAPIVTGSISGTFSYSSATQSVITLNGSTASIVGAGTSLITATFTPTDTNNYTTATTTMTITVAKATRTVTINSNSYRPKYFYSPRLRPQVSPALPLITASSSTGTGNIRFTGAVLNTCTTSRSGQVSAALNKFQEGSCKFYAILDGDANYEQASAEADFLILEAKTFTIIYTSNGATGTLAKASDNFTQGRTGITLPGSGTLSKPGYTFAGWSESGSSPVISDVYEPSQSLTLKAVWAPNQYTISYNSNGGDSTPTQSARTVGQTFRLADPITKQPVNLISYQFAGWKSNNSIFDSGETVTVGIVNLDYQAVWVQQYEVTYASNGGTLAGSDTEKDAECTGANNICTNNQAITLNSAPIRSGFIFAGWEDQGGNLVTDTDSTTSGVQTTVTSSRYIFTAQWTAVSYTITYVSTGSAAPTQSPKNIGQTFVVGAAVTKTNSEFAGWTDGISTYWPDSDYVVGTNNITLTAQWNTFYTVSYSAGSGIGTPPSDSNTYRTGDTSTVKLDPGLTKQGSTFNGWSDGTTTYQEGDVFVLGTSNITLTAQWLEVLANTKDPDQTSSISSITQGCPTDANAVVIKGSFLASITNIFVNGQVIDSSLWKQTATQVVITINPSGASALSIQIFNGQVPLLPLQSLTVISRCLVPAPIVTPTPTPTPKPAPSATATPKPTPSPTNTPQPSVEMVKVGTVYMASGSYSLNDATKKSLIAVAKKINASGAKTILVYGHSDSRGGVNNTVLSQNRAKAVAAYLRPLLTVKKISIGWYSSNKPVKTGTSAAALAQNRRVEIYTK